MERRGRRSLQIYLEVCRGGRPRPPVGYNMTTFGSPWAGSPTIYDHYLDAFLYLPGVMPTDDMNWRRKYLLSTYPHLSAISAIFMGVAVR